MKFLISLLAFTTAAFVRAAEEGGAMSEESFATQVEQMKAQLEPGDKVSVRSFLPNNPDKKVYFGEDNEVLLLVQNDWEKAITIFSLTPSYRQPSNMDQLIKNITEVRTLLEVKPGQASTLLFKFKPEMYEPQLGLHIQLDFTDEDKRKWFKKTAYQEVLTLTESPSSPGGWKMVFTDVQLLLILIVLGAFSLVVSAVVAKRIFPAHIIKHE